MEINWVLIALIPPFLWAIGNIITKVIRTKHVKSSLSYAIISYLISSLLLIAILLKPISFKFELIYFVPIFCGILLMSQYLLYLKAISLEDVSTLIPFYNFDPMIVLILSTIFLNEILSPKHYIAFLFLFIGGILISIKKNKLHLSKGVSLIMASGLIWSIYSVIIKFVLNFIDSWSVYMLARIGALMMVMAFMLVKDIRKRTLKTWLSLNNKTRNVIGAVELSGALGVFFIVYAASLAPISLVTVIGGLQPLFVLIIATILSFKFPKILKEELNKRVIIQKSIAIILMIIGVMFL